MSAYRSTPESLLNDTAVAVPAAGRGLTRPALRLLPGDNGSSLDEGVPEIGAHRLHTAGTFLKGDRVVTHSDRLHYHWIPPRTARACFADSVRAGLSARARSLSCCWFYDQVGSQLFEQICDQPEYYLTRTERSILDANACAISATMDGPVTLVELGSGSSVKTRLLIDAMSQEHPNLLYCPIDISAEILQASALNLLEDFPQLSIRAVAADYLDGLRSLPREDGRARLILFLGSSLGNFSGTEAREFLGLVRQTMQPQDWLMLGTDLQKDPALIESAYNDAAGVTAAFNKNLLTRINDELGGEFNPSDFEHRAPYLSHEGRVEMRLVSLVDQTVEVSGLDSSFHFSREEYIHTEYCQKYTLDGLDSIAADSGLQRDHTWQDEKNWFAVSLLRAR